MWWIDHGCSGGSLNLYRLQIEMAQLSFICRPHPQTLRFKINPWDMVYMGSYNPWRLDLHPGSQAWHLFLPQWCLMRAWRKQEPRFPRTNSFTSLPKSAVKLQVKTPSEYTSLCWAELSTLLGAKSPFCYRGAGTWDLWVCSQHFNHLVNKQPQIVLV